MPNGTEALIHWRSTVEDAAKTGVIEPVVFADLDLENFFNSVEWPAIRASLRMHFPEASQVVEWEQREAGTMVLADGSEHSFNRGAEQGEPLGSLKAALPLGDARGRVAATRPQRVCDEWYIDDGQLVCAPAMLDPWLRAFDAELETLGASRGTRPRCQVFSAAGMPGGACERIRGMGLRVRSAVLQDTRSERSCRSTGSNHRRRQQHPPRCRRDLPQDSTEKSSHRVSGACSI